MIPPNPYLEQFLANSRAVRNEIANSPDLIKLAEKKLNTVEQDWNRGTFIELISGRFGLKKRPLDAAIVEITAHADLYLPELEMSHFATIYDGGDGELVYVVKDFGNIPDYHQNCKKFFPIRQAIKHMIKREYGTPKTGITNIGDFIDLNFNGHNFNNHQLWENFFLFDGKEKWALVDLDCMSPILNSQEIYDGATFGEGRFARLHEIWKRMNTPEYRIR